MSACPLQIWAELEFTLVRQKCSSQADIIWNPREWSFPERNISRVPNLRDRKLNHRRIYLKLSMWPVPGKYVSDEGKSRSHLGEWFKMQKVPKEWPLFRTPLHLLFPSKLLPSELSSAGLLPWHSCHLQFDALASRLSWSRFAGMKALYMRVRIWASRCNADLLLPVGHQIGTRHFQSLLFILYNHSYP